MQQSTPYCLVQCDAARLCRWECATMVCATVHTCSRLIECIETLIETRFEKCHFCVVENCIFFISFSQQWHWRWRQRSRETKRLWFVFDGQMFDWMRSIALQGLRLLLWLLRKRSAIGWHRQVSLSFYLNGFRCRLIFYSLQMLQSAWQLLRSVKLSEVFGIFCAVRLEMLSRQTDLWWVKVNITLSAE